MSPDAGEFDRLDFLRAAMARSLPPSEVQREQEGKLRRTFDALFRIGDSLDRILAGLGREESSMQQAAGVLASLRVLREQYLSALSDLGITPIETVGARVDPARHRVVGVEASVDVADETVLREEERGYVYEGEVLRFASVIAARGGFSIGGTVVPDAAPERTE